MDKNIELIDNSQLYPCRYCFGTGRLNKEMEYPKCGHCLGSGVWKDESYILVSIQPNGQKIAFSADEKGK